MTRALKVVVFCDYCVSSIEDEYHGGAMTLTIDGKGPRQVDLCDDCMSNLSPLTLLSVFEGAQDLPTTAPSLRRPRNTNGGPAQCPVCPHVAGSPQGLGRHTRQEHGATVRQLRGEAP